MLPRPVRIRTSVVPILDPTASRARSDATPIRAAEEG